MWQLPAPISPLPTSEKFSRFANRSENCCNTSQKISSFIYHSQLSAPARRVAARSKSYFGLKCVDTVKPSCYFSTAADFFLSPTHGGTHTGTMAFVAKKIFLTKGVGKHRERLSSFELALRNAGIAACNIVRVSSIFPPNCKLISRSEGLKHIKPGQVAFTVISENSTKEAHRLIAASIGLALPSDKSMYGYLSEHHSFGETEEVAGEYAEELAAEMLATTLNVEFDPDLSWDEKKEVYRISNKIVRTMNVTQSAVGDKRGLWTTVLGAAILIGEDD
jgi:arginine decarboxylase